MGADESTEKVALGRRLFYDKQLSHNRRQSCGTCHVQRFAFSDGINRAVGSEGDLHVRNTPSVVNVADFTSLTWLAPDLHSLEAQAERPLFGTAPIVELGSTPAELIDRIRGDAEYARRWPVAFGRSVNTATVFDVTGALAAFERTIVSRQSPYDRYESGDTTSLSDAAVRGRALFFGRLGCARCHGGLDLDHASPEAQLAGAETNFANNGLYNVDGLGAYPAHDPGLRALTGRSEDEGRFRIPSLRNVAVTAPYMHDGSVATLPLVLAAYARGGRVLASGPYPGDGRDNPHKHPFVTGFALTESERDDVVQFLGSLTDESVATRSEWSDPFLPDDAGTVAEAGSLP